MTKQLKDGEQTKIFIYIEIECISSSSMTGKKMTVASIYIEIALRLSCKQSMLFAWIFFLCLRKAQRKSLV